MLAAFIASQQDDIKRILAYSTLSQLGYMVMAVGLAVPRRPCSTSPPTRSSRRCCFSGPAPSSSRFITSRTSGKWAGCVKDFRSLLDLRRGRAGIVGCPPFSGFFSKDAILAVAYEHNLAIFAVALFTAFLTAFYVIRMLVIVFFGNPRSDSARESRDSPFVMTIPLIVLAILATLGGFAFFARKFLTIPTEEAAIFVPVLAIIALILGVGLGNCSLSRTRDGTGQGRVVASQILFR